METKIIDIFGHTPEEFFASVRKAIDDVEELGVTDFHIRTVWSPIGQSYLGQLDYEIEKETKTNKE